MTNLIKSDGIIYRNALVSDLDQISDVDILAFGDDSYPRFFIRQAFDVFGNFLVVAETSNGKLCAYTLGAINSDNPKEGWIISLGVKPEYQNRGVGKVLSEIIIKKLIDRGVENIFLTVKPNNVYAIALYKSLGFGENKYDDKYFGDGEERLVMVR